jgi:ATP-dependent Clp protease protease subunit
MHSRVVLLATVAAAVSPFAAAFAPSLPASAGRMSSPGRMALRMNRGDIFAGYSKPVMMPEPAPGPDGPPRPNIPMPMVAVGEGQMDIYSRLAKDRILLLGTDVNDEVANNLVAQMLFLANEDPGKDITMYSKYSALCTI